MGWGSQTSINKDSNNWTDNKKNENRDDKGRFKETAGHNLWVLDWIICPVVQVNLFKDYHASSSNDRKQLGADRRRSTGSVREEVNPIKCKFYKSAGDESSVERREFEIWNGSKFILFMNESDFRTSISYESWFLKIWTGKGDIYPLKNSVRSWFENSNWSNRYLNITNYLLWCHMVNGWLLLNKMNLLEFTKD